MYEKRTKGGMTPLMFAIESGNVEIVVECLQSSFNPFAQDYAGKSVLQYALPYRSGGDSSIYGLVQQVQQKWRDQIPDDIAKWEQAPAIPADFNVHPAHFDVFVEGMNQVAENSVVNQRPDPLQVQDEQSTAD